jgi:hypothetical protein
MGQFSTVFVIIGVRSAAHCTDKGDENAFREEIRAEVSAFKALGQKWCVAQKKIILFKIEDFLRCPAESKMTGDPKLGL